LSIVAGIDFGTLSVRASLFSRSEGRLGAGVAEYPRRRSPQDPNGGGIPQKNRVLTRVYANAFNKSVLVPSGDVASLGSAIFAFLASGDYRSVEEAQAALCLPCETFLPDARSAATYGKLYPLYREVYFSLGNPASPAARLGHTLPRLRKIAAEARFGE
jgi:L-ribulokinase